MAHDYEITPPDPWYENTYETGDTDDMDYYALCPKCALHSVFQGQDMCFECRDEEDTLEMLDNPVVTKAERREQGKDKRRYGMVRHLDPDLRPKKFPGKGK